MKNNENKIPNFNEYQKRFIDTADVNPAAVDEETKRKIKYCLNKVLLPDRNEGGYICPVCGNGSGIDGTGINLKDDGDGYVFHCFKCGAGGDIFNIIAAINGLDCRNKADFRRVLAVGHKILNDVENGDYDDTAANFVLASDVRKELDVQEDFDIRRYLQKPKSTAADIPESERRGLSLETLQLFGVFYDDSFILPRYRHTRGCRIPPSKRLIIPTSKNSFLAVLVDSQRHIENKTAEKWKLNAGNKNIFPSEHFQFPRSTEPVQILLVTEGEIDAMSIYQAVNRKYPVLATGGAQNAKKLVTFLNEKLLGRYVGKREDLFVVLLFDNDGGGNSGKESTLKALRKGGWLAVSQQIDPKLDANDFLREYGDQALSNRIEQIAADALNQLPDLKEKASTARKAKEVESGNVERMFRTSSDNQPVFSRRVKSAQKFLENVFETDPEICGALGLDEFYNAVFFKRSVSWKADAQGTCFNDTDFALLCFYLRGKYGIKDQVAIRQAVEWYARLKANRFNSVKDFIRKAEWDGTPRAESLFIDFLRVKDTAYAREVTRTWLTAAIARVFHPGCDFQWALVFRGAQGNGKGTLLRLLGGKFHAALCDTIGDSHALDTIQRSWIVEIEEFSAARKAELNQLKSFISNNIDTRRAPYERTALNYPRHCVFVVTVNDNQFLRDQTGNRRYKILECNLPANKPITMSPTGQPLDEKYIAQVWAEAFQWYLQTYTDDEGTFKFTEFKLRLSSDAEADAEKAAAKYTAEDDVQLALETFLDTPVLPPEIWKWLDKQQRRDFVQKGETLFNSDVIFKKMEARIWSKEELEEAKSLFRRLLQSYSVGNKLVNGDIARTETCLAEIKNECAFSGNLPSAARIKDTLMRLDDWQLVEGIQARNFAGCYGHQRRIFKRITDGNESVTYED